MTIPKRHPECAYAWRDLLRRAVGELLGQGYPLNRNESFAPFFIVGAGRSGTTLLRRILTAGDVAHVPPETLGMLRDAADLFRVNRTRSWPSLVRLVLSAFEFNPLFDQFDLSLRPLSRQIIRLPDQARSLAAILDGIYRYHGEVHGRAVQRWGDKTPRNVFIGHSIIKKVFPDARFVHMLRDGPDAICSLEKTGSHTLEVAAERWCSHVQAARNLMARYPADCIEVRYEQLVTEPVETAGRVCEFLDLRFSPEDVVRVNHTESMKDVQEQSHHRNVKAPVSTSSIGKGRRALSSQNRACLGRIIGPLLAACDYPPLT